MEIILIIVVVVVVAFVVLRQMSQPRPAPFTALKVKEAEDGRLNLEMDFPEVGTPGSATERQIAAAADMGFSNAEDLSTIRHYPKLRGHPSGGPASKNAPPLYRPVAG